MKRFIIRLLYVVLGQMLFGLGVSMTIMANVGYAPWEVFHAGLGNVMGLTIGVVSIIAGAVILIIVTALGEKIGLGTILGMTLTGVFIDLTLYIGFIPLAEEFYIGVIMLIGGLFVISLGTYFYIKSAFGAGPRDNLMVVMTRKTKLPVGLCRGAVEALATLIGWLLGGMVGYGTIISAVAVGFCIQITFRILRFDPTAIKHENLAETFKLLVRNDKRS